MAIDASRDPLPRLYGDVVAANEAASGMIDQVSWWPIIFGGVVGGMLTQVVITAREWFKRRREARASCAALAFAIMDYIWVADDVLEEDRWAELTSGHLGQHAVEIPPIEEFPKAVIWQSMRPADVTAVLDFRSEVQFHRTFHQVRKVSFGQHSPDAAAIADALRELCRKGLQVVRRLEAVGHCRAVRPRRDRDLLTVYTQSG